MNKLFYIFILISTFASAQLDSTQAAEVIKHKEEAYIKSAVGGYVHFISLLFVVNDGLNKQSSRQPFLYTNVVALQFDILGFLQFRKAKRLEKKYKKLR